MKLIAITLIGISIANASAEDFKPVLPQSFKAINQLHSKTTDETTIQIEELAGVKTFERTITTHSKSPHLIYTEKLYHLIDKRVIFHNTFKVIDGKKILIKKFHYDKEDLSKLIHVDYYNELEQVILREVNSPLTQKEVIVKYNYSKKIEDKNKAYGFQVIDKNTNKIIHSYSQNLNFSIEKIYENDPRKDDKINNILNEERVRVALVDSGLDQNHPDLAYKLAVNTLDPIDGIDNDGNGEIDDFIGLQSFTQVGIPVESIKPGQEEYPMSHGSHVGHIMVKDVDNVALYPFTGEYGEAPFLKRVSRYIADQNIDFVNMSFGFPHWGTQLIPKESYFELQSLIKNNPAALFFAAAGNDFQKIVMTGRKGNYPAAFDMDNIVVVGAINSDDFSEADIQKYEVADYSNIGTINVDIFAPGTKVLAASLGGGLIKHTGTSMATPWLLNLALKIKDRFPKLENDKIKMAILLSAYVPNIDNPLPCSTGGMAFPRRAMAFAEKLNQGESSLENIIKEVYRTPGMTLGNEKSSDEYIQKLFSIWKMRVLL